MDSLILTRTVNTLYHISTKFEDSFKFDSGTFCSANALAGTKGVLILNALLPPRTILFHKSQVKFSIPNPTETQQTLEILRVAQPSKG